MTGDGWIFLASYARGVSAVSVFERIFSAEMPRPLRKNRESRLRTAFGFSDSGRIEYYRGDRKAVSNATSRLRLAPLTEHRKYLSSGGTDFTVLEEDQTEGLSGDERGQFGRSRLIADGYFDG